MIQMDNLPEIPSNDSKLNSTLPGFGQAIHDFVAPLIRSALEGPPVPEPCTWLRNVNVGPPKVSKPGEEPTLPTPPIQLEDDSQPITDLPENRRPLPSALKFLGDMLLSESFIDVVADAIVEKLLAQQAQAAEVIDSIESVQCEVVTSLYFVQESGGPIAYAHFDSDPQHCRALRVALNLGNRKTIAYLEKSEAGTGAFFCARAIAQLVLRQQQTPFEAAICAALLTMAGRAPNARITPRADLGSPWNRPEGQR